MAKNDIKILIADDEKGIRTFIKKALMRKGFNNVTDVNNGKKVIPLIEENDIFILDIRMPEMSGMQVLKKIKKKRNDAHVIMITGHRDIENCKDSIINEADDYLIKPFDIKDLLTIIDTIIS